MTTLPALLLQPDSGASGAGGLLAIGGTIMIVYLAVLVVVIVGMWKVFEKARKPGWAAIVPIYNIICMLEIAGRPLWWIILFLIPFANIVAAVILSMDMAKAFGQGAGFGIVMLLLLAPIGYPVLGFGNYKYVGSGTPVRF
jgi:hypothetical protein